MSGSLVVAGLGPGDEALITPEVTAALSVATDVVGYAAYIARVAPRANVKLHASDNREELERAREALAMAEAGRHVVVVSSGDPGVFAMASAVLSGLVVKAVTSQPHLFRNCKARWPSPPTPITPTRWVGRTFSSISGWKTVIPPHNRGPALLLSTAAGMGVAHAQ